LRVQVIHAHPLPDSYSRALFDLILGTLREGGHEVTATDLYGEGFAPALTAAERRSHDVPPYDARAVAAYVEALRNADGLVFCFPQWWFGMPAILKGYFDRVWGPGIAFERDMAGGRIRPLLHNIRLFGVVTSYGSPQWFARLIAGDPGRKTLMRALRPACARNAETFYLAHYDMDRSTPATRAAFLAKVEARLRRLSR
jgi:putative NADPH-quinone reductase